MKSIASLIAFLSTALIVVLSVSIDACLDAAGMWSNLGITCDGAGSGFVPQCQRPVLNKFGAPHPRKTEMS